MPWLSGKSNDPTEMTMPCPASELPAADEALPPGDVHAVSATASPVQAARNIVRRFMCALTTAARPGTASLVRWEARWRERLAEPVGPPG